MSNRHVFTFQLPQPTVPRAGDLIRNRKTGNFINIILEVGPLKTTRYCGGMLEAVELRSVRYGKTNGQEFLLLNGQRSRQIDYYLKTGFNHWEVVNEFVLMDNRALREQILEDMKNVDTVYHFPEEDVSE